MRNYYSNPTADRAIGRVDNELDLADLAARKLLRLHKKGKLQPRHIQRAMANRKGLSLRIIKLALMEIEKDSGKQPESSVFLYGANFPFAFSGNPS